MPCEVSVYIKDSEKKLTTKYLIYDVVIADPNHEIIKRCVDESMKNFNPNLESDEDISIKVKIKLDVQ